MAAGTYYPDEGGSAIPDDRTSTFTLTNDVAIYGGFAGTETLLSQRNPAANVTTLSGEIQQDANTSNNAYHVVTSDGNTTTAILDGFTITGGKANGLTAPLRSGGGIYTNNSQAQFIKLRISKNTASDVGAGLYGGGGV